MHLTGFIGLGEAVVRKSRFLHTLKSILTPILAQIDQNSHYYYQWKEQKYRIFNKVITRVSDFVARYPPKNLRVTNNKTDKSRKTG